MGMGPGRTSGPRRVSGRLGAAVIAAAAGAAVAVAAGHRRRRARAIAPADAVAGLPEELVGPSAPGAPAADPEPTADGPDVAIDEPEVTADDRDVAIDTPEVTAGGADVIADPSPPVEVPTGTTYPPDEPPTTEGAGAPGRPARRVWPVAVAALALVAGGAGLAVLGGSGDQDRQAEATADAGETAASSTTTTTAPVPTDLVLADAADRLVAAGSFRYSGTIDATDVSRARPMLWLTVRTTVTGEVSTALGRSHEVATADDGRLSETVTAGPEVWGRRADGPEELAAEPFERVWALSGGDPATRGLALLPTWLAAAVDPVELAPDVLGRRQVQATLPAEVLGVVDRTSAPVDATLLLVLDEDGDPARVEITSTTEEPWFHVAVDLTGLGDPVAIEPPPGA